MRIILTRHCETAWNALRRTQGQTDIPLNDVGRNQAEALSSRFMAAGIGIIVSSSLSRAAETAEILSCRIGVPMRLDDRLREYNFGSIEGNTNDENVALFGKDWEEQFKDGFEAFGGESAAQVVARQLTLIEDLEREEHDFDVLLVGHGASLFSLAQHLGVTVGLKRGDHQVIEYDGSIAEEIAFVKSSSFESGH